MNLDEIREFAKALEIQSVLKFDSKEDLIRTIQLAEGHSDCFGREEDCGNQSCMWFNDCNSLKAA